jgi:hypothetical protein
MDFPDVENERKDKRKSLSKGVYETKTKLNN